MANLANDNLILSVGEIRDILEDNDDLSANGYDSVMETLETEAQKRSCDRPRVVKLLADLIK